MDYLITDIKCPDCGEFLFDVGGFHACFECGYEQPSVNPFVSLSRACDYAMTPDDDIHG